jgi:hypothetical protein
VIVAVVDVGALYWLAVPLPWLWGLLGDAVGLSATPTFLSLVLWSYVLGPLGALLAVPLSLLTKTLLVDADPFSGWLLPLIARVIGPIVPVDDQVFGFQVLRLADLDSQ